jgi:putative membrane protein
VSAALPARRLHPWSWLFHAAGALKEIALPLLILVVLRREQELLVFGLGAAAVVIVCAYGWVRARSFRYEVLADEIVISEGIFTRESRHVPFTRIQAVSERRGLMHRFIDVTELVLESGSGGRPEAVMRVLYPHEAARLAEQLRLHRAAQGDTAAPAASGATGVSGATAPSAALGPGAAVPGQAPVRLLAVPTWELIKVGLISNRGFLVVATVTGVVSQNTEILELVPGADRLAEAVDAGLSEAVAASVWQLAAWLLALLVVALVFVRLLSIGYAVFTQHGFTLTRQDDRLRVQRGLLTRIDVSGRVGAIQRLVLERTLLHRLLGRCSLRVDLPASVVTPNVPVPRLDQLAPIASPAQAQALIQACLPGLDLQALKWRPLHPRAAWRRWQRTLLWMLPVLGACTLLAWWLPTLPADTGPAMLALSAVLVAASGWHAWCWAAWAGFAVDHGVVVWRSGVLTRRWVLLPEGRAQAVMLRRSPADRRAGTARLSTDVMGMTLSRALEVPWLAEADALALHARLWRASTSAR